MSKKPEKLPAPVDPEQTDRITRPNHRKNRSPKSSWRRRTAGWIVSACGVTIAAAVPGAEYSNARINANDQALEQTIAGGLSGITGKESLVVCQEGAASVTHFLYAPSLLPSVQRLGHRTCNQLDKLKTSPKELTEEMTSSVMNAVFAAVNIAKTNNIETKGQANCIATQLAGRFAIHMGMKEETATKLQHKAAAGFIYPADTPAEREIAIPRYDCRPDGLLDMKLPGDIRFPLAGNVRINPR